MVLEHEAVHEYLKGDYARAIDMLLKAIEREENAKNPYFLADLSLAFAALGDKQQAGIWLERIIALPEETASRAASIMLAYGGLGDSDNSLSGRRRL